MTKKEQRLVEAIDLATKHIWETGDCTICPICRTPSDPHCGCGTQYDCIRRLERHYIGKANADYLRRKNK